MTDNSMSGWRTAAPDPTAVTEGFARQRAMVAEQRAAEEWQRTLGEAPTQVAAMPDYEPSQSAPRHNGILYGALLIVWGLGMIAVGVRRLRQPWGMVAFCGLIAVALIFAGKVG